MWEPAMLVRSSTRIKEALILASLLIVEHLLFINSAYRDFVPLALTSFAVTL
jgi:hypothetical protein